jgi:GNAT superfamily N-acetyltransferase
MSLIRDAYPSDLAKCVQLALLYLETICEPQPNLVINDIAYHLDNPAAFFYLVEADAEEQIALPVGIFYGFLDANVFTGQRFAKERLIFVLPEYRSSRLFADLVERAERWAVSKGCDRTRFKSTNNGLTRLMTQTFKYTQVGTVVEKML